MRLPPTNPPLSRFVLVVGGVVAGVVAAGWALVTVLRASLSTVLGPGRTALEELVMAMSSTVALLLLLWVSLALLASVLSTLPRTVGRRAGRVRDRVAPEAVQRWAGLLLGVAVAGSLAPGAAATPWAGSPWAATSAAVEVLPEGIRGAAATPPWSVVPGADVTSQQSEQAEPAPGPTWTPAPVREQPRVSLTAQRSDAGHTASATIVVRRGDTLWDLAAAHLPPDATDAEIGSEWQRWYATNRAVIGPDPDLILPGQILSLPGAQDAVSAGVAP